MSSVGKLSKVLSKMSKVSRCYTTSSYEISVS